MESKTDEHLDELIDILLLLCEHLHSLAEAANLEPEPGAVQPVSWSIDGVKDRLTDLKVRRGGLSRQ